MEDPRRSFWGWGYANETLPDAFVENFKKMVMAVFDLNELDEQPPPRIEEISLRPPRFSLPAEFSDFCVDASLDRAGHTYGKALRDVLRALDRNFENPPDYVAYPRIQALRMITPEGVVETRELPGTGDGPDPNRMLIGSEGIFGIITEAVMRLQTIPTMRASASVRFSPENHGVDAVRHISQSGLYPANCRLISAMESFSMGIGDGT